MTAMTLTASREENQAKLTAIVTARPTALLLTMHVMATHTFRAVHGEDAVAAYLVLSEIETELEKRGVELCEECGQAGGTHDPAFHDAA